MDIIDALSQLASRLPRLKETVQTEEGTKNALIMPVLQALGYNVFDPFEVVPEYTSDVGTKKGEKVDYVIMKDGKPAILIECKALNASLNINHASQLYRYFACTEARFAILTNGVEYQFYTDIEAPNKMDDRPFFEFTLEDIDSRKVTELKKFSKSMFELENILSNASELKYKKQIRHLLTQELESPSEEFVRLFAKQVYGGTLTQERRAQFTTLVSQAFREWVNNRVSERLQNALDGVSPNEENRLVPTVVSSVPASEEAADETKEDGGIVTTEEELEAYHIVRAILSQVVEPKRIFLKDTRSYCGVLLDHNVRKPLCRFLFNNKQTTLILLDKERNEKRINLESIVDIYKSAEDLIEYAKIYL
ncbi:MAG: type I restriction enzyme HsdR N-terminal domain-containing protein [Akkermansia sp.]|nr:restriction endonuclease [Akkermansiaceae bacterium]MBQ3143064.1 type I restriction enzyme HsdR N-terminal domain-containing protein [Akkermansia sp.]